MARKRLGQPVQARQQHLVARLQAEERVGEVVDVLGGAGEVHELEAREPGGMRQTGDP